MPQVAVGSSNISIFSFSAVFDIYNRRCILTDTSTYNNISGHGSLFVQGIAFSIVDQDGVTLATIDWTAPQLPTPATQPVYTLDLSQFGFNFLFQQYTIIGAIKDSTGIVYSTTPVYKKVCQPIGMTDSGYVPGMFSITPNIPSNILSVSELTPFVYNNLSPNGVVSKTGELYYPTGTINPVPFTGTPFSNNVIYSGQYRIVCTSIASYDLGDSVSVLVSYYTNNYFNVFVGSKMSDLYCCISQLQQTAIDRCNDAVGQAAKQKLSDISVSYMTGISAEINGQDSTEQYQFIKKYLNCDCGLDSLKQNEMSQINPSTTSIIVTGVNGASVTPSVNGNTTTYTISSNVYQIVKGNIGDLAFSISVDNSVSGLTKYLVTFNYAVMAGYILTNIAANPTLVDQLNSLINATTFTIDLSDLNGKCILDIGVVDYFLTSKVLSSAVVFKDITINGTKHTAPDNLIVSGTDAITSYLNSLSLGFFESIFSNDNTGTYFSIISSPNVNICNSITLTTNGADSVINFQSTNKSIVAVLQSIINYLCGLTALQIALGNQISLGYFDYNGSLVFNNYLSTNTQNDFNMGIANSIQNIINRIQSLNRITCATIQSLFQDYPSSNFNIVSDRILSIVGGNCTTLTAKQSAIAFLETINAYSDVKSLFCDINCTRPGTCPDITFASVSFVSGNLAIYGLTWDVNPLSSLFISVRVRITGTSAYTLITNSLLILPNGTISGTSPYIIPFTTSSNTSYDILLTNNCGGSGFVNSVTTPTGGVYSGSYRFGSVSYLVCGQSITTLYSSSPFAIGTKMFTDIGLTTPLTGNTYIVNTVGEIYQINSATGIVLSDTGLNCGNGTANNYQIGNNAGTICSFTTSILYTNGVFAVGGTLFTDSSLSHPVTGFAFVTYLGIIYNLNATSGQIGSATGSSCTTSSVLTIVFTQGIWNANLTSALPFDINVTNLNVRGYSGSSCATQIESAPLPVLASLLAGTLNAASGVTGMTCASNTYTVDNSATVNGTLLTNGGTVVISGVTVTVIIMNTTCSLYTC